MNTHADVALILWNPDVIEWVSLILRQENLRSCGMEPSDKLQDMEGLIASCSPSVVVLDLSPPYADSAQIFLRLLERFPDRSFVLTCADPILAVRAARWLSCHLMLQKPYEPDVICKIIVSLRSRVSSCSEPDTVPLSDVIGIPAHRENVVLFPQNS
jgi:DNA-binding NarL/FixJ family response regulator